MHSISGYVYAPDADPGLFAGIGPGAVVRLPGRSPPWIVVDHALDSALVARWPGRLYRVLILDAEGVEQASAHARYTRAVAVRVGEGVPAWRLFGDHGEGVAAVIAFAAGLELPTARRLAERRHPLAGRAYSRAWGRWLGAGAGPAPGEDWGGTLAAGPGPARSPVNCGLSLTYRAVWDRAGALFGPAAFVPDEEGEPTLAPVWASAADALLDAAMALGAPQLVAEDDAASLTEAWRSVAGRVTG